LIFYGAINQKRILIVYSESQTPKPKNPMKKIAFLCMLLPLVAVAQRDWSAMTIETTGLAPGIHRLFVGGSVSVIAFTGDEGVLLIDVAYEQTAPQLKAAVKELSDKPLRYIVNTHIHGDHTGGNMALGEGVDIIAHHAVKTFLGTERTQGERVIPAFPVYARPNITFSYELDLEFNGQTLQMLHLPEGHTNSDIIIYFPESNVLVLGDLLFADNFPFVDVSNGGHPFGFIENLGWIIANYPDDAVISGGHGPVYTMDQLAEWRQTLIETVEVIDEAKRRGLTAEEMKTGRILEPWADMGRFFITEDRWIDTLFPFLPL
jgi:cyclase